MATTVVLKPEEYEALLNWARVGASEGGHSIDFTAMRNRIDRLNGLMRYTLVIRYEALPEAPRPGISPTARGITKVLELLRPPTREDVIQALGEESYHPSLVLVTADPNAEVGWYELDRFPWS